MSRPLILTLVNGVPICAVIGNLGTASHLSGYATCQALFEVCGKRSPKRFDRRKAEWTVRLRHWIDFKFRKLAFSRMEDYTDFDSFGCNSLKIGEYK